MCWRLKASSVTLRERRDMDRMAPCALLLLLALISCTSAQSGTKSVLCSDSIMAIGADLSLFPGYTTGTFTLSDSSCTGTITATQVMASTPLDGCGTVAEEVGENLVFKNTLRLTEDGTITRTDDNQIQFSCSYPKSEALLIFFQPQRTAEVLDEDQVGSFTFAFEFFDSDTFETPVDTSVDPFEVNLRDFFYMRIKATSAANTEVFVESCKATPGEDSEDTTFYDIIENGCDRDSSLERLEGTNQEIKFGLQAFKFIGEHDQVFITCTVILCIQGQENTRCSQGCTDAKRKRSVAGESARHSVIQGPLRLKRSPDEKGLSASTAPSLAFTLNVVAETLLFAVAVVCAVVAYKMKKSNTGYERFPPSEI